MKKRLTVLVGAGGSVEVGLPSTTDLLPVAFDAVRNVQVSKNCIDTADSIASGLEARCYAYFGRQHFNFEHLMHVLEAVDAMKWALRAPGPSPGLPTEPMLTADPHPSIAPALDSLFSYSAPRDLIRALHKAISKASQALPIHPNWTNYARFWQEVDAKFELNVGTLNYDSSIEQALGIGPESQGFASVSDEGVWRFECFVRAKQKLREHHIRFEVPDPHDFLNAAPR